MGSTPWERALEPKVGIVTSISGVADPIPTYVLGRREGWWYWTVVLTACGSERQNPSLCVVCNLLHLMVIHAQLLCNAYVFMWFVWSFYGGCMRLAAESPKFYASVIRMLFTRVVLTMQKVIVVSELAYSLC